VLVLTKSRKTAAECEGDLLCGVNIVGDVDKASDLEKKHLPVVSAPQKVKKGECFEVEVEVGKLLEHPNEPGHFIEFVELYAGDTYLARMDFAPKTTRPIMKTSVTLDHRHGMLRAFSRCNLHGTWENDLDIEVMG